MGKVSIIELFMLLGSPENEVESLRAILIDDTQCLTNFDRRYLYEVETGSDPDFSEMCNLEGVRFTYNRDEELLQMVVKNPYPYIRVV